MLLSRSSLCRICPLFNCADVPVLASARVTDAFAIVTAAAAGGDTDIIAVKTAACQCGCRQSSSAGARLARGSVGCPPSAPPEGEQLTDATAEFTFTFLTAPLPPCCRAGCT
ncbi:hypothetical protein Vafri_18956 [Volvox africanus]|uniref:Uncharacterized protein n=1 Tax=Volvox africanus TaxID=51714 RepID=A0A8J4BQC7_9CHLO|nr:hypothetical protein Vafri_18956 [Volvox africanus]